MLIDSEKLKEELIETDNSIYQTSRYGINLQTTLSVIDHQKEVGGWHTGKPKSMGEYPVFVRNKDGVFNSSDFWLKEENRWADYGEWVVAWYELPPYKKEKKRDGSY